MSLIRSETLVVLIILSLTTIWLIFFWSSNDWHPSRCMSGQFRWGPQICIQTIHNSEPRDHYLQATDFKLNKVSLHFRLPGAPDSELFLKSHQWSVSPKHRSHMQTHTSVTCLYDMRHIYGLMKWSIKQESSINQNEDLQIWPQL